MKYNKLGSSDLQVSEISFGCMSLSDDHSNNTKLLHKAFDKGINFFDTADLYQFGENEVSVGKALQDRREKVIIATKVGNQWRDDKSGWDWNPTKKYILSAVHNSLKRLQTDYIDLYQLHGGTIEDNIEETIEAFEILKEQGKIRAYGISSIRPNVIRKYIELSNICSIMMQYSLLDRRPEESCLALLKENNIGVLARGSLAKGLLAGKKAKSYLSYSEQEVAKASIMISQLAEKYSINQAQIAIKFILAHRAITSSVCGVRTEKQLQDILKSEKLMDLSKDDLENLHQTIELNFYEAHR